MAVKTIAQVNRHHGFAPFVTPRTAIVVRNLTEDRKLEITDSARPNTIKSTEVGDKDIIDVLSGGYSVQPIPEPNSDINEALIITHVIGTNNSDMQLTLGKATSDAPK